MNSISAEEGSAQGRILAWQAAGRMALDHPLMGVGSGHFPVAYGVKYRPPGGEQYLANGSLRLLPRAG